MRRHNSRAAVLVSLLLGLLPLRALATEPDAASPVDFNRDIRPILSNHCYKCHGPDQSKRKAGLRLDVRDERGKELPSGGVAIVPGNRAKSSLFARITAKRDRERMPPRSTGKTLTPAEIERLGRWIDLGAKWATHWAYVPPKRPALPKVKNKDWP